MVFDLLAVIFAGLALGVSLAAYATSRRSAMASERSATASERSATASETSADAAARSATASEQVTAIQVDAEQRRRSVARTPRVSVANLSATFDSIEFRLVLDHAPSELTSITIERVDSDRWLRRTDTVVAGSVIEWLSPAPHSSIPLALEPGETGFVLELVATAYDAERWQVKVEEPSQN